MNQESRESYGDEAAEGDTSTSQGDGTFDGADDEVDAAHAEENAFNAAPAEERELFFVFAMAAAQMDPNDKKSSVLAMEAEPVTATDPKFWKWVDQRLDDT